MREEFRKYGMEMANAQCKRVVVCHHVVSKSSNLLCQNSVRICYFSFRAISIVKLHKYIRLKIARELKYIYILCVEHDLVRISNPQLFFKTLIHWVLLTIAMLKKKKVWKWPIIVSLSQIAGFLFTIWNL